MNMTIKTEKVLFKNNKESVALCYLFKYNLRYSPLKNK